MPYTYELGVIESNKRGDIDGVFIAENSHDMQRLVERINDLTAENDKLREQLAEAMSIIEYIDKHAPLADDTCDEPGITLSEAARRAIADNAD